MYNHKSARIGSNLKTRTDTLRQAFRDGLDVKKSTANEDIKWYHEYVERSVNAIISLLEGEEAEYTYMAWALVLEIVNCFKVGVNLRRATLEKAKALVESIWAKSIGISVCGFPDRLQESGDSIHLLEYELINVSEERCHDSSSSSLGKEQLLDSEYRTLFAFMSKYLVEWVKRQTCDNEDEVKKKLEIALVGLEKIWIGCIEEQHVVYTPIEVGEICELTVEMCQESVAIAKRGNLMAMKMVMNRNMWAVLFSTRVGEILFETNDIKKMVYMGYNLAVEIAILVDKSKIISRESSDVFGISVIAGLVGSLALSEKYTNGKHMSRQVGEYEAMLKLATCSIEATGKWFESEPHTVIEHIKNLGYTQLLNCAFIYAIHTRAS
ncbi:hypothetical protein AX774_g3377 [Zancudomyces culisetae]|uniref:Uncharacterized protein n=1 Tax=Zancudomyces culisetae TaxID=1213189 RepID=A0A1R1PQA7_ZANCU|nr:hypothetical protein AX774_g3377 [Zancudomyces culisetae]|eukprot:OMH83121.1 hypothetical protein AX774_g3377 [Zancudomyces culisetae]